MVAPFDESENAKHLAAYMILARLDHAEYEKSPILMAFLGGVACLSPSNLT
jgi:hypothetical protein